MIERIKGGKKFTLSVTAAVVLAICLCVTTFAILFPNTGVDGNVFQTGTVKINLNDGKPVINEEDFLFEPGMTVEKKFFIENEGSCDIYYKLYFENVSGNLADVLEITVGSGTDILFRGAASDFTEEGVGAADIPLSIGEKRELTISFYFPDEADNSAKGAYLTFDMKADAVQTKNNPDKLFE